MAGMKFNADIDLEKIVKLRQEINKLKKSLIAVAGIPNSDAAIKQLESEIERATKKLSEYEDRYVKLQKIKYDIDSSDSTVKRVKEEASALQSTNKWIIANTESVKEADRQIKQLKKDFNALSDEEKVGDTGTVKIRQIQQLAAQRLVEEEAVRKTIKAQKDQIIQSNAEEGSITALRKQLILLIKDYDDLGRIRRGGDAGKALLTQISNVQKELNAAEQASGRFQRNVGNYASAWNGLGNSVQQVARELPSLAVNANTFFLAISNNFPILVDEIAKARKEYANFKAELKAGNKDVKAVAPVWQQLTKSLISWQTALVVGLTLLSLHGKEVINWGKELVKGKNYVLDLLSAEQEMALARRKGIESSAKERIELELLYTKLKDTSASQKERTDAANAWISKYPKYADVINGEKVNLDKLKLAYNALSKEIEQSAIARSYMDKAADIAVKKDKEDIKLKNQQVTLEKARQRLLRANEERGKALEAQQKGLYGSTNAVAKANDEIVAANKAFQEQKKIYNDISNNISKLDEQQTAFINHINTISIFPQPKEGTYDDDKGLSKEYNSIVDQNQKISDLIDKQSIERKRREEDLENQVIQSRIDAMADGEAKIRAQRELDNKKEIQDLKRQREDYIRTEIEYQKRLFDAQEDLNAKKSKDYKKKTFDPSSVKVDTSNWDSIIENREKKQIKDLYTAEANAMREYLKEYGTFQQKKEAITAEYNEKIANASTKGEKESLKKEKESKLKDVNFEELKSSINFADIFGDLDVQSTEAITNMRDKLKKIINESAKDLKPTDLKSLQDALSNIDLKIAERNPFEELKQGIDDYKDAANAVIKAQEDLNTVQQNGEVIVGTYIDETGKLVPKLLTQEQAERNLSDAQKKRLESQGKLTKAVNSIGEGEKQVVQAGNDLVNTLSNLGIEVPESIRRTLEGMGQVMDSLASIDLMKPMSILTGITGTLAGIGKTIGSIFGGNSDTTAKFESLKEQLGDINEIYEKIIEKSKEDIVFGGGFASVKKAEDALDTYYKKVQNYRLLAEAGGNVGSSKGSHSYAYRANERLDSYWGDFSKLIGQNISSIEEMYNLTGDQLYLIQTKYPEAWGKIPSEITDSLNAIIACKDEANELNDALNQAMTGVDFDSFYNGFIDSLSDMDTSFEDMCDDFEGYLRTSIMSGLVSSQYQGRINDLYQKWSDAAKSENKITEGEANALQEQYQQIVQDMMHDREEMAKTFEWDSSSSSQSTSKKGFATASQDSIDELNGRFTALQIAGEEIKNQNQQQTMSILELKAEMLPIIANTSGIKDIASETRDLLRLSYEELTGIHDDTTSMNKSLKNIETDIAEVKRNTNGLTRK